MSSSRRSAGEINILAALERRTDDALPRRMLRGLLKRKALFWYGTAGVLVCGLVGMLAWLARDGGSQRAGGTVAAASGTVAAAPAPREVDAGAPARGAAIVNIAPAPVAEPDAATVSPALPVAQRADKTPAGQPERHGIQHDLEYERQHAARNVTGRIAAVRPAAPAKPAPAAAHPAPARGEAALAAQAARRRAAGSAKTPVVAASVDTDVALITAIIQHANAAAGASGPRPEADDPACADKTCGPRMPARP